MKTTFTFSHALPHLRASLALLICLGTLPAAEALAQTPEVVYPADAGVINVTQAPYFAKGDGTTDNTAVLQQAINDYLKSGRILFFPKGTYLISNKLTYGDDLNKAKNLILQGQSQAGTVIKLANSASGYGSASAPKPLLTMFEGGSTGQAFRNGIYDLTFDVGSGNPGAIGVEFMNNNQGGMENVTIRSSDATKRGATGLSFTKSWPGPAYFKNVTIEGFDYGIRATNYEYSLVFEHLTLRSQKVAGLRNTNQTITIRDFRSTNTVPVIQQLEKAGHVSVLGGSFTGGSSASAAITDNNGRLILRNVSSSGYGKLLDHSASSGLADVPSPSVTEYYSHATNSLWPSPVRALGLAVEEAPSVATASTTDWVKVANGSGDDAASIQAAIDAAAAAGKTTVYFPKGTYTISKTIRVHGSVQRLCGLESTLEVVDPLRKSTGTVFKFENLTGSTVVLERFRWAPYGNEIPAPWEGGKFTWLEHASSASLVVKRVLVQSGNAYKAAGTGKLFVEDVCATGWTFGPGQQVWARQINPESNSTMITNNGAALWVLGVKTEGWGTVISTTGGGKTEVVGGLLYPVRSDYEKKYPAFVIDNASASLTFTHTGNERYEVYVQETRGSETRQLLEAQASNGRNIVLFSGHNATASANTFSGIYTLTARHSGKALDVGGAAGGSLAEGAIVHQWTAHGKPNQQWKLEAANDGRYVLTAQHSGKVLEVSGGSTINGAKVQQAASTGSSAQSWKIEATSDGYYKIINVASGKVLDVDGGITATGNGALVHQWTYRGDANQQWKLEKLASPAASAAASTSAPSLAASTGLLAFPNPSPAGRSTLALEAKAAQRVSVYLHNTQGQLVSMFSVACQPGRTDFRLPAVLAPGTYYLRATLDATPQHFTLQVE